MKNTAVNTAAPHPRLNLKRFAFLAVITLFAGLMFSAITAQMQSADALQDDSQISPDSPQTGSRPDILWMRGAVGVTSGPYKVQYTPDGQYFAVLISWNVKIVRVSDGMLIRTIYFGPQSSKAMDISPNGQYLAVATEEYPNGSPNPSSAKIYRLSDGELQRTIPTQYPANAVAFSPDSAKILTGERITGGYNQNINLWNVADGSLIRNFNPTSTALYIGGNPFTPDGSKIAINYGLEAYTALVNVSTGAVTRLTTEGQTFVGSRYRFSPNGRYLADGYGIIDTLCGSTTCGYVNGENARGSVAFSSTSSQFALGYQTGSDGRVKLLNTASGTEIRNYQISSFNSDVFVDFSPNGQTVIAVAQHVFSTRDVSDTTGASVRQLADLTGGSTNTLAISADGQMLATGAVVVVGRGQKGVQLWNMADGSLRNVTFTQSIDSPISYIAFTPDGQTLFTEGYNSATNQAEARFWNTTTGNLIRTVATSAYTTIRLSPDGIYYTLAAPDGTIQIRRVVDDSIVRTIIISSYSGFWGFTPNSQQIVALGGQYITTLQIYNISNGALATSFDPIAGEGLYGYLQLSSISPDGSKIALIYINGKIRIFDVATGNILQTMTQHTGRGVSVDFSPNGQNLLSSALDGTTRIWRISDGALLQTYDREAGGPTGGNPFYAAQTAYSPNSSRIAWVRTDGAIVMARNPYPTTPVTNYTISGNITRGGSAVSGVSVAVSGSSASTTTTDSSGNYSFTVAEGGSYTVTPSLTYNTFAPASQTFDFIAANQTANFTATAVTYTISGNVQADGANLQGATVALSGSQTQTVTTDANGGYSFTANAGGNYTVTVSKNGLTFNPADQTFNNLQANQTANFQNGAPLCTPPPMGLVAWYKGENNTADSVGGNNGMFTGTAAYAAGKVNTAFSFNGSSYVSASRTDSIDLRVFTIEAWIKPNTVETGTNNPVIVDKNVPGGTTNYLLALSPGNLPFIDFYDAGGHHSAGSSVLCPQNQWCHVTGSYDGYSLRIYVNGALTGTTAFSASAPLGGNLRIGQRNTGQWSFNGLIDDVKIYDHKLEDGQIQSIYNAGSAGACQFRNPVAWYKAENNYVDSSGNGNNATPVSTINFAAGQVWRAFSLDGSGYATVPVTSSLNLTRYTISAWIRPTTNVTSPEQVIVDKETPGSINYYFALIAGNKVEIDFNDGAHHVAYSTATCPINQWCYVAGSYDGSTLRIYVNGALSNSTAYVGTPPTAGHPTVYIGRRNSANPSLFIGLIDETQIFNQALAASEIQAIYNEGSAGFSSNGATFTGAGSLDPSFGTNGKVTTPIGSSNDLAHSVAIQADGKIVAAGNCYNCSNYAEFAVVRYNTDGSLDTSFGGTGKVVTPIGSVEDVLNSVAIQADGRIVAAGYSYNGTNYDFAVVRYNTDGSLDSSFGTGGKVTADFIGKDDIVNSIAIQSDGKVVLAGSSRNSSNFPNFAIARFKTDGNLDTTFGTGGKVTTTSGNSSEANSMVIASDGKILLGGYSYNGIDRDFALARYNSNGSLDNTFGTGGNVTTPFHVPISASNYDDDTVRSIAIQTDGNIVAGGETSYDVQNAGNSQIALARYNTNGSLDTSFGNSGKLTTALGSPPNEIDIARSISVQSDGKIIAGGYTSVSGYGADYDFFILRYNISGSLDSNFGTNGKVTTLIGKSLDIALSTIIQTDGKIVAAGYSDNGTKYDFAVVRYNTNSNVVSAPVSNANVTFANVTQAGYTVATPLTQSQLPALPAGYTLPTPLLAYDIRTSAGYSGNITVTFNVPNVADAATCDRLRSLHFEAGAWTPNINATPIYNAGTQVCTVSQTVMSLSPFVVALTAPVSFSYEADVQNRPLGDGFVDSDDIQQIRRFSVGNNLPYQSNEFQRTDCSPRSTSGDGFVDGDDIQQARRYSVGTDSNQLAGGPSSAPPPVNFSRINNAVNSPFGKKATRTSDGVLAAPAAFRIDAQNTSAGSTLTVPIRVDTVGNEAGYTFSIAFNSALLTNPSVVIGNSGGDVLFNANNPGQIGFSVTTFTGGTIAAGNNKTLVTVTFTVAAGAQPGTVPITFTDTPARRKASPVDPNFPITQPTYMGGTITIGGATAAGASISGRVLTANGRGIRNVLMTMTDANGNSRTAITTAFGYYLFDNVATGAAYIIEAKAKRYKFAQPTQIRNVSGDIDDVIFTADGF